MSTIRSIVKHLETKALSNVDIEDTLSAAGMPTPVILYSQLDSMTPAQLMRQLPAVLLYEHTAGPNCGHWTCLLPRPGNRIEFFDPYGDRIDSTTYLGGGKQKLLEMLYNAGQTVVYNDALLQAEKPGINTCGRHVIARLRCRDLPIDAYCQLIRQIAKKNKLTPDDVVTLLTAKV